MPFWSRVSSASSSHCGPHYLCLQFGWPLKSVELQLILPTRPNNSCTMSKCIQLSWDIMGLLGSIIRPVSLTVLAWYGCLALWQLVESQDWDKESCLKIEFSETFVFLEFFVFLVKFRIFEFLCNWFWISLWFLGFLKLTIQSLHRWVGHTA